MDRQNYSTGTPWEPIVGYSRAVRVGPMIFVSGTTATGGAGEVLGGLDPAAQTLEALRNIENALAALGAGREHIVRTRVFVTNIAEWEAIGRVHGEFFRDIRPATTIVEVSRLIAPEILVEIEADAVLPG